MYHPKKSGWTVSILEVAHFGTGCGIRHCVSNETGLEDNSKLEQHEKWPRGCEGSWQQNPNERFIKATLRTLRTSCSGRPVMCSSYRQRHSRKKLSNNHVDTACDWASNMVKWFREETVKKYDRHNIPSNNFPILICALMIYLLRILQKSMPRIHPCVSRVLGPR
jgi:hypothetical protein